MESDETPSDPEELQNESEIKTLSEPEEQKTNYRALFVIGITFLGAGTALAASVNSGFYGLTAMGLIFMIIGLANRDKWETSD
jgi:hypothetical protein